MRIDCRDLECPEPVLRTKKALDTMEEGVLEVLVNAPSSEANILRFAKNGGYTCRSESTPEGTLLSIVKGYACEIAAPETDASSHLEKTLFIKDDKVGEGELGYTLMKGFLKTTLEFERLPKQIIFVNRGVLLTTDREKHGEIIEILEELSKRGVAVYSCGLCMNHFGIPADALEVGEIGNAYDTMEKLLHSEVVSL